jgi:hypothetical protein
MDNEMTPLNRIMPQQSQNSGGDDGDDLVNEILSDVNQLHHTPQPVRRRPMASPPQPQPQLQLQLQPQPHHEELDMEYDDEDDYIPPRPRRRMPMSSVASYQQEPVRESVKDKEDDFFKLILDNAKLPLIVGLLVLLMGMTYADNTLGKFIPSLMTETGNLGFGGLVAKAITAGLLFYVLQRLLS